MLTILSWNVAQRHLWGEIAGMAVDVALLQECPQPPEVAGFVVHPGQGAPWGDDRRKWRTAVLVRDAIPSKPLPTTDPGTETPEALTVSRPGTVTAVELETPEGRMVVASVYAVWEHAPSGSGTIYADTSAHRILSDLSGLMTGPRSCDLLVAGDWNVLHGYGEHGDPYWGSRYATVFDRAKAIGLDLVGPQFPNGRQADPWPDELPADSKDVPTFHTSRQTPATATRQLDFAFASQRLARRATATAMNDATAWGPSDHCQIHITISPPP